MNNRIYMGIDPGSLGFITVMYPDNSREFLSLQANDYQQICRFIMSVKERSNDNLMCCMEEVHAVFGSSAKSTFSFGKINGVLEGILIALSIPYTLVQPKAWQGVIWSNPDKEYIEKKRISKGEEKSVRSVDTKKTSLNAAKRLFPSVDLRKSERASKYDDNKCDSLLICEYGRRMNL